MPALFRLETNRVSLTWRRVRDDAGAALSASGAGPPGRLAVTVRRAGAPLRALYRDEDRGRDAALEPVGDDDGGAAPGPRLFEQTDYAVYLRARGPHRVTLVHADPVLLGGLAAEEDGRVVHGVVNFAGQLGASVFGVLVDGAPELDFAVEVFATKLDYAADYAAIRDEVQALAAGLALEYVRATFQPGAPAPAARPSRLEWLALARDAVDALERALAQIRARPITALARGPSAVRTERVRRVDAALRAELRRGGGRAGSVPLAGGAAVRGRVTERRARPTLDTPEHRWIAGQLARILRGLAALRAGVAARAPRARRGEAARELAALEARVARLARAPPLADASGDPPPGFASMQLLGAPGYREAYRACTSLALGVGFDAGPLALALKDLALLYEYWCYLTVLRLVAEESGAPLPARELVVARETGLGVALERGRESRARFDLGAGRSVEVAYNPRFAGAWALVPQRPDIVLTLAEPGWPPLRLLLDAKYRLDDSAGYVARYGLPGPPEDALNALHRYRDAIVDPGEDAAARPRRAVVQAAALYPYREPWPGALRASRLGRALETAGVGAIPLLPGADAALRAWLRRALGRGGYGLADVGPGYAPSDRAAAWRAAAGERVLLLDAPPPDGDAARRVTLSLARHGAAAVPARWVAWGDATRDALPCRLAPVAGFDVATDRHRRTVAYHLGPVSALARPAGARPAGAAPWPRWTSRLALERARTSAELWLAGEAEWRLREALEAARVAASAAPDADGTAAQFVAANGRRARLRDAAWWVDDDRVATLDEVVLRLGEAPGGARG